MATYRRGKIWWYEFWFANQRIRESAKTDSRSLAKEAEKSRRRQLEEAYSGIRRRIKVRPFSVAAAEWLELKRPHLAPRSVAIEQANLGHLRPVFGSKLTTAIEPEDIARYQRQRLSEGAAPKTANLEVGTLRAILRKNRQWAALQPDVQMLKTRDDVGRAISEEEEKRLLDACLESRSRSLYPGVVLALSTAMRYGEIRLLKWSQVDFGKRTLTVGESKTEAGTGRILPLNDRAFQVLSMWAARFPNRESQHYVFPSEKYGAAGDDFKPCAWGTDPTKPIGNWKEAWEAAKKRAKVVCRFHDLRHSGCTRMLEAGVPFSVVATIMGWSPSTTIRMTRRYGHIGQAAQREAVSALEGVKSGAVLPQKSPQLESPVVSSLVN